MKKEAQDFFDLLNELEIVDSDRTELHVLYILSGECCGGDYIVTSDEDESHDFEALTKVIAEHEIEIHLMELKVLYDKLKPFLVKRTLTWG